LIYILIKRKALIIIIYNISNQFIHFHCLVLIKSYTSIEICSQLWILVLKISITYETKKSIHKLQINIPILMLILYWWYLIIINDRSQDKRYPYFLNYNLIPPAIILWRGLIEKKTILWGVIINSSKRHI